MISVPVTVRREKKTNNLVLFLLTQTKKTFWIECFTKSDQHAISSYEYMENHCIKVKINDPEVIEFVKFWEKIGPKRYNVMIWENI